VIVANLRGLPLATGRIFDTKIASCIAMDNSALEVSTESAELRRCEGGGDGNIVKWYGSILDLGGSQRRGRKRVCEEASSIVRRTASCPRMGSWVFGLCGLFP